MTAPRPVSTRDYKISRFGILNADGQFWTSDTFESEQDARAHIVNFWGRNEAIANKCLKTHKIIPVRVTVEAVIP